MAFMAALGEMGSALGEGASAAGSAIGEGASTIGTGIADMMGFGGEAGAGATQASGAMGGMGSSLGGASTSSGLGSIADMFSGGQTGAMAAPAAGGGTSGLAGGATGSMGMSGGSGNLFNMGSQGMGGGMSPGGMGFDSIIKMMGKGHEKGQAMIEKANNQFNRDVQNGRESSQGQGLMDMFQQLQGMSSQNANQAGLPNYMMQMMGGGR